MTAPRHGFLALLHFALALAACGGDDERTPQRYFPLTTGSWWEYETNDGPIRREVAGRTRRANIDWSVVTTRLLDGHRHLAIPGVHIVDTTLYAVRGGDLVRFDERQNAPVTVLPLGGTVPEGMQVEEVTTDTVPIGVFEHCMHVHRLAGDTIAQTLSFAPDVGMISDLVIGGGPGERLIAYKIARSR
jgi:hypothetical protein